MIPRSGRRVYEAFFDAERKARRLTRRYVVVECRPDDEDPPGVEATFVVCPENQVHSVPNHREVVFIAEIEHPSEGRYRAALVDALCRVNEALGHVDADQDPALGELLGEIRVGLEQGLNSLSGSGAA